MVNAVYIVQAFLPIFIFAVFVPFWIASYQPNAGMRFPLVLCFFGGLAFILQLGLVFKTFLFGVSQPGLIENGIYLKYNILFMQVFSLLKMVCLFLGAWFIPRGLIARALKVCLGVVGLEVLALVSFGGTMTGTTFSSAFLVTFLPVVFLLSESRLVRSVVSLGLLLPALYFAGSTTFVVLLCQLLALGFFKVKTKDIFVGCVFVLAFGFLSQGSSFLSSPDRLIMWSTYMDWWQSNAPMLTGLGLGSFQWVAPFLNISTNFPGYSYLKDFHFVWMHNDWLQVLFEMGLIGFVLMSLSFFIVLKDSLKSPAVFTFFIGLMVHMCFYSPLQFSVVQIAALFLVRLVYGGKR